MSSWTRTTMPERPDPGRDCLNEPGLGWLTNSLELDTVFIFFLDLLLLQKSSVQNVACFERNFNFNNAFRIKTDRGSCPSLAYSLPNEKTLGHVEARSSENSCFQCQKIKQNKTYQTLTQQNNHVILQHGFCITFFLSLISRFVINLESNIQYTLICSSIKQKSPAFYI